MSASSISDGPQNEGGFYSRTLELALDPHGATFKPAVEASAALRGQSAREAVSEGLSSRRV